MKRVLSLAVLLSVVLGIAGAHQASATGNNVFVNHKGNRICVAQASVPAHLSHGDVTNFMPC